MHQSLRGGCEFPGPANRSPGYGGEGGGEEEKEEEEEEVGRRGDGEGGEEWERSSGGEGEEGGRWMRWRGGGGEEIQANRSPVRGIRTLL